VSDGPRILAFAGSTRTASLNKRLLRFAVAQARETGIEVTHVDLRDFPMPLYDGDLEEREGIPAPAKDFKRLMIDHAGFLIASPEYNSSISGVLKNAIDWASRPEPGEPSLVAFKGKVAGLVSASPGALGGLRGLVTIRSILGNVGVLVIPEQVAVMKAHESLEESGAPKEERLRTAVRALVERLATVVRRLASP
jgi:NAD(P)H-dependent FMN reductase